MEQDPSWTQMLPVLLGGALALAGGIVGQLLTHYLDDRRDQKRLRREKGEELVRALYRDAAWLEEKNSCLFRRESHNKPSPLDEAWLLQKLYFPSMVTPVLAVMKARTPLIDFLGRERVKQMKDFDTWLKEWDPTPFHEAYKVYIAALSDAVAEMRSLAEEIA